VQANDKVVGRLNSFLRGEISAVETYRMALDKLQGSQNRAILQENLRSHESRVALLRDYVMQLGGQPATSSGAWGAVTKLWTGGAAIMGEGPVISALEEGEDHGMRDYRDNTALADLDRQSLNLVTNQLLPEQQRTHRALSSLKQQITA
jgi:uncharacterized protein (TIGR02284 family)